MLVLRHQASETKPETYWQYILPKAEAESVLNLGLVFGPILLQDYLV